jgi:hypothetical protein
MKANYKLALTLLAGIGLGGAIIEGVHAQMKAPGRPLWAGPVGSSQ